MKKLVLGFILFSVTTFAQDYVPFPDSGAVWVNTLYEFDFSDPIPTPVLSEVKYYCVNGEDTLVDGENYTKLNYCGGEYVGAVRDNGGQVFFIPKDSLSPYLIYDFTVSVGDVLPAVYYLETVSELTVSAVDSVLVNGIYRTTVQFDGSALWIEGIGNTFGLLREPWDNISGYMAELYCMHMYDTTYINSGYIDFNPGGTCPLDVGFNENTSTLSQLKVFPNPSTGVFTVQTPIELDDAQFVLTDLTGKIIDGSIDRKSNQYSINIEDAEPGVYLLTIFKMDQLYQFRLIKE